MVLIFKTKPLLNTMTTYAILWTASDINEQKYISKKKKMDPWKTIRMTVVGTFVVAPLVFSWIRLVERKLPGKHFTLVAKKVVLEQIVFAPFTTTCFYTATSLLERKDPVLEVKNKFFKTYTTGLMFWPIVQTVNFSLVPHLYRPVLVAGASFIWSTFLCFMKEEKKPVEKK